MGTASTMACITAALGLIPLKGGASAPAVSSARLRIAESTGRNAVAAAEVRRTPQSIISRESVFNAITVLQAIGGSTNGVVHLLAIVNRHPELQGKISLDDFDLVGRRTPMLIDLKPSGDNYMTDFHQAGGMVALLHTLRPLLHLSARTITGQTLGEVLDESGPFRPFSLSSQIIRPLSDPLYAHSSLVVLHGNLAPDGAVLKASASKDRGLLAHSGPAVVFENSEDLALRIDSPDLPVTAASVLVLKSIGPVGNPGMPEAGLIPIPRKLASQGVTDMLRISDGRMSGTAGGTIVLHVSPEAAVDGSPLGIVENGDSIQCDAEQRLLSVDLSQEEMQTRWMVKRYAHKLNSAADRVSKRGPLVASARGYRKMYVENVNQAHHGADFKFMTANGQ